MMFDIFSTESLIHVFVKYAPFFLSGVTIYMTILAGNMNRYAWVVGLVGQSIWLTWILLSKNYGFLPMNLCLWVVYSRNHFKWNLPKVK